MVVTERSPVTSPKMKHSRRAGSERGWYLLEYAVVILGVSLFIVGFSDLSRIFHARGAVRAGVTEGLRCLYPTDPGCSTQNLSNGWLPSDRFNAFVTGDQSLRFELPRISHELSSAWFMEPVLEAEFATKRLSSVTLTQPEDAFRQYQVLFPSTAHAVYLLKTRELPRVGRGAGDSAQERVLHPRFFDPDSGAIREADQTLQAPTLSLQTGATAAGKEVLGEIHFTIPSSGILSREGNSTLSFAELLTYQKAHGFSAACYQGGRRALDGGSQGIQWPTNGNPARCAYRNLPASLFNGSELRVPIMIHVSGRAYLSGDTSADWSAVRGSVELELWQGGELLRELGGRSFSRGVASKSSEQWGNFVVRGAGKVNLVGFDAGDAYLEDCDAANYSECSNESYVHLPLVKVDSPVTLRFALKWSATGKGAKNPKVRVTWGRQQGVEKPEEPHVRVFYPQFQATHEQRPCGYASQPNSCSSSVAPMQTSFRSTNLDHPFSHSARQETICGRSAPPGHHASISAALEGFRAEIRAGARRLESIAFWSNGSEGDQCSPKRSQVECFESQREYMKGCEPEYSIPSDAVARCALPDYQPQRDTISDPVYSYGTSDRVESRGACSGEPFPECARGQLRDSGEAFLGATANGCAAALRAAAPPQQIGPLLKNSCVDELPGFIDKYRQAHAIPGQVAVNVVTRDVTPVISPSPPTGGCREYRPIPSEPGGSWLCAERASYAVANRCCQTYGDANCSIQQVRIRGGGGQEGRFNQVVDAAVERTFETVQAAYPPVKMDLTCGVTPDGEPSDDGCIDIQAGPADNGTRARIQASMRVPLPLFGWLGLKDHTVVHYEETRTLESAIVGGGG